MTRYALLASHLMPVVHAATVDTELAPAAAQRHVPIARLCDPLNSQAWVAERVPWADDEQVSQAMAGPNACRRCASAWAVLRRAHADNSDEFGTPSLLNLLEGEGGGDT